MTTNLVDNQNPIADNSAPLSTTDPAASADPKAAPLTTHAAPNVDAPKADPQAEVTGTWKDKLSPDLRNSSLVQKFDDSDEGFSKAFESHANLEQLLGHEKVPIPKDADDIEGWNRFSKAMGIPDKAEGYGLGDAEYPEEMSYMKESMIKKDEFAEIVHAHKLTPDQAKGLWSELQRRNIESFERASEKFKTDMDTVVNKLRGEWGDAYDTNIELGQTVINKFTSSKEDNDYITAMLSKDPKGIKFLAKIGGEFSENKIGDFAMKNFSLSPEQAQNEITKIQRDPNHAYNNEKATPQEHDAAVDYVNSLFASISRAKG